MSMPRVLGQCPVESMGKCLPNFSHFMGLFKKAPDLQLNSNLKISGRLKQEKIGHVATDVNENGRHF